MPLQGTFDVLDFSDVMRLLSSHQLTGRLHVRSRSFGANIFFEEGALVGADQSEHQSAASTGDVRGRVEEICFEMLDAERGGFEFQPGRPSPLPTSTRLPVDTVLARARKRLQEWQELQELLPSLDLQPRLVDDLSTSEITIDQERWRMLTAVDGRRSLRALGRALNLSDFDVCRIIKGLLDDGVVEIDPRAAAVAPAGRDGTSGSDRETHTAGSAIREAEGEFEAMRITSQTLEPTTLNADNAEVRARASAGPGAGQAAVDASTPAETAAMTRTWPSATEGADQFRPGDDGDASAGAEGGRQRRRRVVRIRSRSETETA